MKKWILCLILLSMTGMVGCAGKNYTVPDTNPTGAMPTMTGGLLFSNTTRASYISPRVDVQAYQVLGKVKSTVSMWNVLALVSSGNVGWDAIKKEALKPYPDADDIVNFTVDSEYLNVLFFCYMRLKVNVTGLAVKYKEPPRDPEIKPASGAVK